ncbi:hypothetical protein [Williamsia sp. Leaf354]|uniref:hypothetical protein n=1 Tax=Williamsia sp. Leaf354 TaxID=1736349 RepID=UPI0009E92959|nr:hypothetical protein [Williamsia sp. Leaf354]
MTETTNRDALQAAYFVRELELAADTLVCQIAKLDLLKGAQREAQRRRRELYDVRRQIEAIRRRFPLPSSPRPSHRGG